MTNIYQEHILDHYKRPRGRGELAEATHSISDSNPLCGDSIEVKLKVVDGVIVSARHEARGCAVSQAGASMLFERLEGMKIRDVMSLSKDELLAEFGSALSVSRIKCALLALSAVKKALVK
jgi:nitrogen fixation NifU-like protein